jgi:hypothetical protein
MKGDKWPLSGYVDPCARAQLARPERFFDFDTLTGEILVKNGLSQAQRYTAMQTITDLGLNAYHHLKKRLAWLTLVAEAVATHAGNNPAHGGLLQEVTARSAQMSSITRVKLRQMGYAIDLV